VFLTVDSDDKRPIYQQIVDGVKALIARGDLRDGMQLPSVRQIARDLRVNLNTVAVAYRQLQEEGFLAVRHGAGAVVSGRPPGGKSTAARRALLPALTELVLDGLGDREILAIVRTELQSLRRQGERK
jgi:GntR family transcriptional regulator